MFLNLHEVAEPKWKSSPRKHYDSNTPQAEHGPEAGVMGDAAAGGLAFCCVHLFPVPNTSPASLERVNVILVRE